MDWPPRRICFRSSPASGCPTAESTLDRRVVRFPWPAGYSQDAVSVAAAGPLDKDSEFAISCSILQFICGTQFSEQSLPHAKFPPGVLRVWLLSSASALAHPPSARLAGGVRRREVVCLSDDDSVGMRFSNKIKFPSPQDFNFILRNLAIRMTCKRR